MSHYPLAVFMSLIKGFFDFFVFAFAACYAKEPYQVQEKITYQNLLLQLKNYSMDLSCQFAVWFSSVFLSFTLSIGQPYMHMTMIPIVSLWYPEEQCVTYRVF